VDHEASRETGGGGPEQSPRTDTGGHQDRSARMRRLARVVLKVALFIAAGAYLLYLLAINVFLSTRLFDVTVNADPGTLQVRYERGWSIWPGTVHARTLSIRSVDSNVEWILRIAKVRFDVSFAALVKRRFQASDVRGTGISFRLRTRVDSWDAKPERLSGLPPIEGLSKPPVRPYKQCSPEEWSDADYHLITVLLSDVHADDVREIWIDRYQLVGETSITGGFFLKPIREVRVGPVRTTIQASRLLVKDATWVDGLGGSTDLAIASFDPRTAAGKDILRGTTLDVDLHGTVPDIATLPLPLPSDVHAHGAVDLRRLAARFEHGSLAPGSRVEAVAPGLVVESEPYRLSTAFSVDEKGVDGGHLVMHAMVGSARLERQGETLVAAPRIDATGEASGLGMDRGLEEPHVVVESGGIDVPDLRTFATLVPKDSKIALDGGHARAELRVESWPDDSRATGRASMQADDLDVRASGVRVRGGATAKASVDSFDWRTRRLEKPDASLKVAVRVETEPDGKASDTSFAGDVRAVLLARDFDPRRQTLDMSGSGVALRNVSISGAPPGDSRGDVSLQNATLRLEKPEKPDLEGVVSADVTDATALLGGVRSAVPIVFRSLLNIPRLLASARLTMTGEHVALREVQAHGGTLAVHGVYVAQAHDHLGAFVVEGGPITVGLQLDPGGTHVRLFDLSGWLLQQEDDVAKRMGR
jgi:hypothetical protein